MPSVGIFIGITTSTPYGLPSVLSSSQSSTSSSSSASLNRTQPSTPSPPARETAAATCSDGVKAKIGYSMPNRSHSAVRIVILPRPPECSGWLSLGRLRRSGSGLLAGRVR